MKYVKEGRVLVGNFFKLAAPFISRLTSAFVGFDLYNQVREYRKGHPDALVPMIGDSIQLTSDAISIGVEVGEWAGLSSIESISAVLGPVTEFIGLVVFVGEDIYSAVRSVEELDKKIHLTGMEKFDEGLRAFFYWKESNHIKEALEEQKLNNQVVRDIIEFLKINSDIKRAVYPSIRVKSVPTYHSYTLAVCSRVVVAATGFGLVALLPTFDRAFFPEELICETTSCNEVFLDKKVSNIRWIRTRPDEPPEGKLFCIPNVVDENEVSIPAVGDTYRSKDAIGVKYSENREGKGAFINLTEGDNTIVGFRNKNNIFAIGQGHKNIAGGDVDDVFNLVENSFHNESSYVTGILDGRGGTDTVNISALALNSGIQNIFMNFQEKKLHDTDGRLSLEVKNMNIFIGRKGKIDTVTAACDTRHIDTKGGVSDSDCDTITISDDFACNYDAKVLIRPYTKVDSKPKAGLVKYIVSEKEVGTASVNIESNSKCDHQFIFANYTLDDISSIKTQESSVSFSFSVSNLKFKLLINGSPTKYSYQLSGYTKLIVGEKNLYALHNTTESMNPSSIERYSNIAKKLKMNLVAHSNNEVLSVGHDHNDVMENDHTAKVSHLVSNGGENIFTMKSGSSSLKSLSIASVVIYNFNRGATRDVLDLREINKQVKESLEDELTSTINEAGQDLEIILSTKRLHLDLLSSRQDMTIILKDALKNHWYNMLDLMINGV